MLAVALKRSHEPQRFVGDLLQTEISEKQARSIKYQLTVARLPLAKDDDFAFKDTPINEALVRDVASGALLAQQRNAVLIGETGIGKTHLAIAIARNCIRAGSRGRFFTTVDLVNQLEAEARAGRQGRIRRSSDQPSRHLLLRRRAGARGRRGLLETKCRKFVHRPVCPGPAESDPSVHSNSLDPSRFKGLRHSPAP
jgi:hypothetical protein